MRRNTDTNRIVRQLRQTCVGAVALSTLMLCSASLCFGQATDSGLPDDFRPPPPTPKELAIEKPLIEDAEVVEWRKRERSLFLQVLGAGRVDDATTKVIEEGFRVSIQEFSISDRRSELSELRKGIRRYVDQTIDSKYVDMKKLACSTVVKHATALLDGNFHVRLQAVLLIGEMNLSQEVPGLRPKPAVAYIDGLSVLLDVIQAPKGGIEQPEPVRILAAMGAQRLLEFGRHTLKINSKLPVEAAKRILTQLEGGGTDWYHLRLAEALVQTALSTVPNDTNQQEPVIVEALARILANPQRSYRIRARAARLLGRTPMPGAIQSAPIAYSIVKLTHDIATDLNQRRVASDHAIFQLNDVYLAFKAVPGESTTDGGRQAGMVSTLPQQPIQSAYKDILPIIKSIFRQYQSSASNAVVQATIEQGLIDKLATWTKPNDMTLGAGRVDITKPLRKPAPATKAADQPRARRPETSVNGTT